MSESVIFERRKGFHTPADCVNMETVKEEFAAGSERMSRIEDSIKTVSDHQIESDKSRARMEAKLDENNTLTYELLDIIKAGKGFFKTIGWLVEAGKWVLALALPLVSLWYAIKDGPHK